MNQKLQPDQEHSHFWIPLLDLDLHLSYSHRKAVPNLGWCCSFPSFSLWAAGPGSSAALTLIPFSLLKSTSPGSPPVCLLPVHSSRGQVPATGLHWFYSKIQIFKTRKTTATNSWRQRHPHALSQQKVRSLHWRTLLGPYTSPAEANPPNYPSKSRRNLHHNVFKVLGWLLQMPS